MSIRVYYKLRGGHYVLRVFVGPGKNFTHALAGELCIREEEFKAFRASWPGAEWRTDK